ncbi:MAG: response regulator transcription factor [Flavisolibacter sp.]|nr:response regulator transcription factor [Flavisolibacter sp.]
MRWKCMIVDDEPLARKVLKEYIDDTDFLELSEEAGNPLKALNKMASGKIDIIFLDIQMPKLNGIDFLKSYKQLPPVILTTAFPEYALEGYELDVVDYLVKPITYERFLKAALKAKEYIELKQCTQPTQNTNVFPYFFIKCDNKLEKIFFADILFIEGLSNYIVIHTHEKKYITYLTMRSIEERLPGHEFVQIHRSYIVSIPQISRLDMNDVWIKDKVLPISKGYKEQLMQRINEQIVKR